MTEFVAAELRASIAHLEALAVDADLLATVDRVGQAMAGVFAGGGKVFFAGNGGSAADAQHIACELVCRLRQDRAPLAAIALTTDTSILTAAGNDYGFEQIFARQVEALGRRGDMLVAISTSGRSPNVLAALEAARKAGLATVGLTGRSGGTMAALCDHLVRVPHDVTHRIQEAHIVIGHIWCAIAEKPALADSA